MTAVLDKPLLAFSVTEENDGTGGIVFAKTNAQARREGSSEFADGDFSSVKARRAPWADQFSAQGYVPTKDYLSAGWYWPCHGCDVRMSDDMEVFEDEPEWTIEDIVEPAPGRPFHNQACLDNHRAHEAARKRRQDRAIEAFKRKVLKRFPGVEFSTPPKGGTPRQHAFASMGANGRWRVSQIVVAFDFPGQDIGPAALRYDQNSGVKRQMPYFTCCNGDREAFRAFAGVEEVAA